MPDHAATVAASLDANFKRQRLVFAAVCGAESALPAILEHTTGQPVVRFDPAAGGIEEAALRCAKVLALDDTVVFGRTLLLDAQGRAQVLSLNAQLNAPPPPPQPGTAFA
jgi:hypothetical protein